MKLEQFDELIKDGQIDTDGILKIRDALNEMNTTIEGLNSDLTTKENRIKDLQETNSKLYLRVTGQVSNQSDEPTSPSVDDIIKSWR